MASRKRRPHRTDIVGSRHPLLTIEREGELGRAVRNGGPEAALARGELVLCNQRLVIKFARRYLALARGMDLEDLCQYGNIGLIVAADKFDPDANPGTRFSTFASWWIRQAIVRGIRSDRQTIRVPTQAHDLVSVYKRAGGDIELVPDPDAVASIAGLAAGEARLVVEAIRASLTEHPDARRHAPSYLSTLTDPHESAAYRVATLAEDRELLRTLLARIEPRSAKVVWLRHGLGEEGSLNREVVGARLGITGSRVGQIERRAIADLASMAVGR